ncbi:MAG: hypothetical protein LBC35_08260 [Coriobacteriales bacterium]|jgi:hypothetical protein|nr:hypothetical protein [Coriobacteriales bacterium]
MLTKRQNFLETIRGGKPDRFVNQYEPFALTYALDPLLQMGGPPTPGVPWVDAWGVTQLLPVGGPGVMPVHDDEHIVLKDITQWRNTIKAPNLEFPEQAWEAMGTFAAGVDRTEHFLTMAVFPGLLERLHHLMSMEGAMIALACEPDAVRDFIEFYVDWEIAYADLQIKRISPDALFHHDDWGSSQSTLIAPAMFAEIFLPAYKRLYGWYKDNGIEIIVHHSDSYAATLVPYMIEMGIDVWQGVMSTNNTPELIARYGGQISFMGDIDNRVVDVADWTEELVREAVETACRRCGKLYFIPNTIQGGPESTYPGVYEAVSREIDRMSALMFD